MRTKQMVRRRDRILELLTQSENEISVRKLLEELQVSDETLRKDLVEMERQGTILRKHGRILLADVSADDPLSIRSMQNRATKERIAREVLNHISYSDECIGLDVGSTVWYVAKLLAEDRTKIAITNSLEISTLYGQNNNNNIYCTGGMLRSVDKGFYGYWACDNLRKVNMGVAVLGTPGIMGRKGLGAISYDDKELKQIYVKNSQKTIAVFDSSKCNCTCLIDGAEWEDIDIVISDTDMSEEDRDKIGSRTRLILV